MLTKLQIRTAVQEYIDDPAAKTWSATSLDLVTSMVYDGLWSDVLDMAPYWNSAYQQLVSPFHAPGYIDLRLVADGGDLTSRLYRIQQVMADGVQYYMKDPRDYLLMAQSNTGDVTTVVAQSEQQHTYQVMGDQLWLHPLRITAMLGFMELRYSFRPPSYVGLAAGDNVAFVDGAEHALVLSAAAHALARADTEDSSQIRSLAAEAREKMFASIRRRYHGPTQPFTTDSPNDFGGV